MNIYRLTEKSHGLYLGGRVWMIERNWVFTAKMYTIRRGQIDKVSLMIQKSKFPSNYQYIKILKHKKLNLCKA